MRVERGALAACAAALLASSCVHASQQSLDAPPGGGGTHSAQASGLDARRRARNVRPVREQGAEEVRGAEGGARPRVLRVGEQAQRQDYNRSDREVSDADAGGAALQRHASGHSTGSTTGRQMQRHHSSQSTGSVNARHQMQRHHSDQSTGNSHTGHHMQRHHSETSAHSSSSGQLVPQPLSASSSTEYGGVHPGAVLTSSVLQGQWVTLAQYGPHYGMQYGPPHGMQYAGLYGQPAYYPSAHQTGDSAEARYRSESGQYVRRSESGQYVRGSDSGQYVRGNASPRHAGAGTDEIPEAVAVASAHDAQTVAGILGVPGESNLVPEIAAAVQDALASREAAASVVLHVLSTAQGALPRWVGAETDAHVRGALAYGRLQPRDAPAYGRGLPVLSARGAATLVGVAVLRTHAPSRHAFASRLPVLLEACEYAHEDAATLANLIGGLRPADDGLFFRAAAHVLLAAETWPAGVALAEPAAPDCVAHRHMEPQFAYADWVFVSADARLEDVWLQTYAARASLVRPDAAPLEARIWAATPAVLARYPRGDRPAPVEPSETARRLAAARELVAWLCAGRGTDVRAALSGAGRAALKDMRAALLFRRWRETAGAVFETRMPLAGVVGFRAFARFFDASDYVIPPGGADGLPEFARRLAMLRTRERTPAAHVAPPADTWRTWVPAAPAPLHASAWVRGARGSLRAARAHMAAQAPLVAASAGLSREAAYISLCLAHEDHWAPFAGVFLRPASAVEARVARMLYGAPALAERDAEGAAAAAAAVHALRHTNSAISFDDVFRWVVAAQVVAPAAAAQQHDERAEALWPRFAAGFAAVRAAALALQPESVTHRGAVSRGFAFAAAHVLLSLGSDTAATDDHGGRARPATISAASLAAAVARAHGGSVPRGLGALLAAASLPDDRVSLPLATALLTSAADLSRMALHDPETTCARVLASAVLPPGVALAVESAVRRVDALGLPPATAARAAASLRAASTGRTVDREHALRAIASALESPESG